jgi:hypothetical protein
MDDQFLRDLKVQPSSEFAARLRATLHSLPPSTVARVAPAAAFRRWFAAAASIAVVGFAFTLPPVQAAAQAFLDFFRVRQFTGVEFDAERLRSLETEGFDAGAMFGNVEPLTSPQQPVSYATAAEAGAAAGIAVLRPTWIPPGYVSTGFSVSSEHGARITANTAGLQALLDALGLPDVELPDDLDGQTATVRIPPIVSETYQNGERELTVIQAQSPDVAFPAGLDLTKLAYAGLRILGMPREEAYRMSVTIDWRSTLVVPVPSQAGSYRPINVAGNEGLLIEGRESEEGIPPRLLMWSADGRTFAVGATLFGPNGVELLEIAQTLQ